jgi:hypothetical protein
MTLFAELPTLDTESLTDAEAIVIAQALEAEANLQRYTVLARQFPPTPETWPFDYGPSIAWKTRVAAELETDDALAAAAKLYYRGKPKEFINHWCWTYDPRNAAVGRPVWMPFLLFERQEDFVDWLMLCIANETSGLTEKSRDMGATWLACGVSVYLWLFVPGSAVGWGSRKEDLVDRLGVIDSIFEKIRTIIRRLPRCLLPEGFNDDCLTFMRCINPETNSAIIGEAGDNIGRGGRTLVYFKDESAHYAHPEAVEAALSDNTRVQIDISSVNGMGNVFHRSRESGKDWIKGDVPETGTTSVFVMDWRDHPAKDEAWYEQRRKYFEDRGLPHIFAQEVDRDYAASVEGIIIPALWVKAAIDAHIKLAFTDDGAWCGGLDVADGGGDVNALAKRKGVILKTVESWGAVDTGETARRAVAACEGIAIDLQYDSIGVGAGVKAETNRLETEGLLPPRLRLIPWNAGASVLNPMKPVLGDDFNSPLNKDFYKNLKAQAWWELRQRFERTYRAVTEQIVYDPAELISLPSDLPNLRQIEKELSQPTAARDTSMRLIVNKTPEGTRSPNLADAIVMAYHPIPGLAPVFSTARSEIALPFFPIPPSWPKGWAMKVDPEQTSVLWAALDADADVLYITTEHVRESAEITVNASAIKARGAWIPGVIVPVSTNVAENEQLLLSYAAHELNVVYSERQTEAAIADMFQRLSTGRLKVFDSCPNFFTEYRNYRRDEAGKIMGGGLMECARAICRPVFKHRMIVKPPDPMLVGKTGRRINPYR